MAGIIVGVDGSGHSQRALEWAAKEAVLRQVPLTVLTVHEAVRGYYSAVAGSGEDGQVRRRCSARSASIAFSMRTARY